MISFFFFLCPPFTSWPYVLSHTEHPFTFIATGPLIFIFISFFFFLFFIPLLFYFILLSFLGVAAKPRY